MWHKWSDRMYVYSIVCRIGILMCITKTMLYSIQRTLYASVHFQFCGFNVCQIVDGAKFTANRMSNCVTAPGHAELCNQRTILKMENRKQRRKFHAEMMTQTVWPTSSSSIPAHHVLFLPFKIYESHNCGHIYGICCPVAVPVSWHWLPRTWIFQFNPEFLSTLRINFL